MATALAFDPLARLLAAVGSDALITDSAECAYYAQDVHTLGPLPLAVFRPDSIDALVAGVKVAAAEGLATIPRGGGMSYTRGYVADAPGALIVDLGRMNRILDVDPVDMTVTVEAGCTWAALHAELAPRGLRTPVWGSLSGIKATVGGGMSQNGVFWGASRGSIATTALSFDVVLAEGAVIRTGNATLRPFGPDLTGLFAADAGAFGLKAHITLSLIPEATAFAFGSFAFDTQAAVFGAMSAIARAGLATESFGFDPFLQAQRMRRDSLAADVKSLARTMTAQGGFWKGLKEGAKVVAAGRSFLDDAQFSVHLIVEGRTQARAEEDLAEATAIAIAHGGRVVANTIPKVMRANPFPPVNSMLGPDGERWVPVHGVVAHSRALPTVAAIDALYADHAEAMERLGVGAGYMFLPVAQTGFLIEPVFFFPDAIAELHRRSVEPAHLARLKGFPEGTEARALVDELRCGVIAIFTAAEGIHFQLGRLYPFAERVDPRALAVLRAVKDAVDPGNRMNPGALGL
jgi:FAD/FMN-containing dehydrogenase